MDEALQRLNSLPPEQATAELLKCCGSTRWAEAMAEECPFADERALLETADRVWQGLGREDWLEAFRSHPKIGERKAAAEVSGRARRWSEAEQARARDASAETLAALARANKAYEDKFGFIFIVCASGKSAEEMLSILGSRLGNERDAELRVAAGEQGKITRLRLRKLLET